jgi:hypothetical protein
MYLGKESEVSAISFMNTASFSLMYYVQVGTYEVLVEDNLPTREVIQPLLLLLLPSPASRPLQLTGAAGPK